MKKNNTEDTTVSPHYEEYRYPDSDTIHEGPCKVSGGNGWLTNSQMEEWAIENSPLSGWMRYGEMVVNSQ